MDDRTLTIVLRLIHILAGIFWVGVVFLTAGFLIPAVKATGQVGGRFMEHLALRRRLPMFLGIAAGLTVLSGLIMYVRLAAATHGSWASTPPGIAYGVGAVSAILGAAAGMGLAGSAGRRMAALGQSAGPPAGPTAEQRAEIERLQGRMTLGARLAAGLLAVAAGAMAVARYL